MLSSILALFRRRRQPVVVNTYTVKRQPRASINDALHMKLRSEVSARSHTEFADAFDHARRAR